MIHKKLILTFCAAALVAACGQSEQTAEPQQAVTSEEPAVPEAAGNCPQADESGVVEIRQGLTAKIIKSGYGRAAVSKDYADVHTTLMSEIMHTNCKTTGPNVLAAEAIHILEENKITSLLVADDGDLLVGALNIHYLFRAGIM